MIGNRAPRGWAGLLTLLAAALGAGLLIAGFAARGDRPMPDAGRPPSTAPVVVAVTPPAGSGSAWRPRPAPTIGVGPVRIAPARAPSGIAATVAGNPIGSNPIPLRLVRLAIPALGVSAPVLDEGVAADGLLQIPADPRVLGRWSGGAQAGEPYGTTVVAGHVDNTQIDGALFALRQLKIGQQVVAVGADGRTVTYRVVATRQVAKARLVSTLEPFLQNVSHRLVIVTCGGAFDPSTRQYADNVLVFTVPVART